MPDRTRILSISYYVPDNVVKTIDIEKKLQFKERFGLPYGILTKMTGCREHREARGKLDASDLAVFAAKKAIEQANIPPDSIDLLLFCACDHDIDEPATVNVVAEKLGLKKVSAFDVKNACNSFLNGLDIADAMIKSGKANTVLVTTGEVITNWVCYNIRTRDELKYKAAGLTLGDGGAAAIVVSGNAERVILASHFETYGEYWKVATVMAGGTMYPRCPQDSDLDVTYFLSDSEKILELALEKIPPVMEKVMAKVGWRPEDVDLVLGHQVTIKIMRDILNRVNIPFEKTVVTVDRYGNTGAASIPIALCTALEQGRLKSGMKVLLVGGASGFSAGVMALIW
ncbi:MAG: ketoacyl-ACP synthase III [candidate division WOR-3 bacterium]|nr:ketoacyl-ACP synthase III [candidate division WOR-3 bacterium]